MAESPADVGAAVAACHGSLVVAKPGFNPWSEDGGHGRAIKAPEASGELQRAHASRLFRRGALEYPDEQVNRRAEDCIEEG